MIYLTGDTHADFKRFNSDNFPEGKDLTKDDYVVVMGDFGGIWTVNESSVKEQYWLDWLSGKPWTTLFVCGNHENFDRLNKLPSEAMFGSVVGKVTDSIFHLRRGEVYNIDENKIFCFGGARSIDKEVRLEYISWWKEEEPSFNEMGKVVNLPNFKFDYIFTHECPESIFGLIADKYFSTKAPYLMHKFLKLIDNRAKFKKWYFGHYHIEETFNEKYQCLFESIIKLGE